MICPFLKGNLQMSPNLVEQTGNGIIQIGNGIIYPTSSPPIKKLLLKNVAKLGSTRQE